MMVKRGNRNISDSLSPAVSSLTPGFPNNPSDMASRECKYTS
ncbi:hypothetical protein SLEP1_g34650 [Rubroshorea leprosula]|uniref:Uncharacterized protein n=1 Tax=Rubroshorea leprosula TaxID=152421 RepID=A0AAV5KL18_9ROSI|nr:hypothetical protein SLEP1_g34650 [Rubroshorea leprosula]